MTHGVFQIGDPPTESVSGRAASPLRAVYRQVRFIARSVRGGPPAVNAHNRCGLVVAENSVEQDLQHCVGVDGLCRDRLHPSPADHDCEPLHPRPQGEGVSGVGFWAGLSDTFGDRRKPSPGDGPQVTTGAVEKIVARDEFEHRRSRDSEVHHAAACSPQCHAGLGGGEALGNSDVEVVDPPAGDGCEQVGVGGEVMPWCAVRDPGSERDSTLRQCSQAADFQKFDAGFHELLTNIHVDSV